MEPQAAYNIWATQYDTNKNRTRDLEATALRSVLADISKGHVLEMGCGTGKNTGWLAEGADSLTATDFSEGMLQQARQKCASITNVKFLQADMTQPWTFAAGKEYNLATFSLVLEHIEDLNSILKKAANSLASGGHIYIGELHPFKQYSGTKARFEIEDGIQEVTCYTHHVSDFTQAAFTAGLSTVQLEEWFDDNDRTTIPRLLTLLLRKD